ncbi:MAG: rRNA maturation RNase YbeY [Acidobacteriota bacterium]
MKATFVGEATEAPELQERLAPFIERLGQLLALTGCTFSIMLTDDKGIADYNQRFRQVDGPTDVLSFPAEAGSDVDPGHYLGDLVISLPTARKQAEDHDHEWFEEVELLILHGVLHLIGHDHETDEGQMREVESRLARELFGSLRGLVERTEDGGSKG